SLARAFRKTALLNEDDTRLVAMQTTAEAGWRAFPVGTGFGTFDPIFRLVGGDANLGTNFVNHAHNDYVELWLTGGLAAAALIFGFLWWFVGAARASWRARSDNAGAVPRVAAVSIAIILVHSLVDYPLRTAAMSAIFAVCCGLLLEPVLARRRLDRGARPYGGANPAMPAREALALRARQEALAPAVLSPALGTAVPPSHFADAPASVESCAGTGR
ncbi:O-antigen ligase family protein, partial [Polymorphobacter multimanifer]